MRRRQQGFALFELVVAMLIATLLAVWASDALVRRAQEASAQAVAAWMQAVQTSVAQYLARHSDALRNAVMPHDLAAEGYADWRAPTLSELKQGGLLSVGFPEAYGRNLQLGVRLLRDGHCPGEACQLEALVYSRGALDVTISGRANEGVLADWQMAAKGRGGVVSRGGSSQVAGPSFSFANPPAIDMPALPEGAVALAVTRDAASGFPYLKVGDSRDPKFGSVVSVTGTISSGATVRAQSSVWLGTQNVARTACPENGLIAREQFGGLLVCRGYQWQSAGGRGGGGYAYNSVSGCTAASSNPVTGDCSCPVGYSIVLVSDSGPKADAEGRTRGYLCTG